MNPADVALVLSGALAFLVGAAGIDIERRKPDGAPTMALAIMLLGAAVFVLGLAG